MLRTPRTPVTVTPSDEHTCTDLTARQELVWRAMRTLQRVNGDRPPTRAEIAQAIGVTTTTGAVVHFGVLQARGYIVRAQRGNRDAWLAVIPSVEVVAAVTPSTLAPDGNSYGLPLPGGPSLADGLTLRNLTVWRLMWERQRVDGVPPTQSELSNALGMKSPQGVQSHLFALAARGYVVNKRRMWIAVCKETPCESSPSTPPTISPDQPDTRLALAESPQPTQPLPPLPSAPLSHNPFLAG